MQHESSSLMSPARQAATAASPPLPAGAARRELAAEFVAAAEQDRRRLAESIHDDSIQAIVALGMRLQMLRRGLSDPAQLSLLSEAERAVQAAIGRLRYLVVELDPPGLLQEGLSVALALALEAADEGGQTRHRLDDRLSSPPGAEESVLLFRIAQAALMNVHEHARATRVTVTLLERDGGCAIRIADDGRGFESWIATAATSGGFASMRARARLGGGRVDVDSSPGAGTTVEAWLPDAGGA
jgi:signal transduction histidine kinase